MLKLRSAIKAAAAATAVVGAASGLLPASPADAANVNTTFVVVNSAGAPAGASTQITWPGCLQGGPPLFSMAGTGTVTSPVKQVLDTCQPESAAPSAIQVQQTGSVVGWSVFYHRPTVTTAASGDRTITYAAEWHPTASPYTPTFGAASTAPAATSNVADPMCIGPKFYDGNPASPFVPWRLTSGHQVGFAYDQATGEVTVHADNAFTGVYAEGSVSSGQSPLGWWVTYKWVPTASYVAPTATFFPLVGDYPNVGVDSSRGTVGSQSSEAGIVLPTYDGATFNVGAAHPGETLAVRLVVDQWQSTSSSGMGGSNVCSYAMRQDLANPVIDLTVEKLLGSAGGVYAGDSVSYSLTPHNNGPDAAAAGWSVTEVPPAGLTITGMTGAGYNCVLATLTCTDSSGAPLASGADGETIAVTATVDDAAQDGVLRNVTYISPASGDVGESNVLVVPAAGVDTAGTATNNDAHADLTVLPFATITAATPMCDDASSIDGRSVEYRQGGTVVAGGVADGVTGTPVRAGTYDAYIADGTGGWIAAGTVTVAAGEVAVVPLVVDGNPTCVTTTTTMPPTTVAPTTVAPTTVAPTTVAPTTVAETTTTLNHDDFPVTGSNSGPVVGLALLLAGAGGLLMVAARRRGTVTID